MSGSAALAGCCRAPSLLQMSSGARHDQRGHERRRGEAPGQVQRHQRTPRSAASGLIIGTWREDTASTVCQFCMSASTRSPAGIDTYARLAASLPLTGALLICRRDGPLRHRPPRHLRMAGHRLHQILTGVPAAGRWHGRSQQVTGASVEKRPSSAALRRLPSRSPPTGFELAESVSVCLVTCGVPA